MESVQARLKRNARPTDSAPAAERSRAPAVTEQAIRERAYQIFFARGDVPGNAMQDWLRAELELRSGCTAPQLVPDRA